MHNQRHWGYIFTLPFTINLLVFVAFPILFSAYLSFAKWDLFNPIEWIGLKNWSALMSGGVFWTSVRNIFYFALVFVPLQTVIALVLAYLLNQSIKGKSFFRMLYFLPVVTPWMAGGMLWTYLYGEKYGLINYFLGLFGIPGVNWLNSGNWWVVIGAIAIVQVWKGVGSSMILLLAGMQNISKEMQEAAEIDGANGWNYFTKIVFPLVSPMVFLVLILSTISAFGAFDVFLSMWGAYVTTVPDRNLVPNMLIYRDAFMLTKMGSASAQAWMLFFIILVITLFQRYFEKKWVHYE